MARFYEIKSSDSPSSSFSRRDFDSNEEYEAYKEGYECGYEAAMEESGMGMRQGYRGGSREGMRRGYREDYRGGRSNYRDEEWEDDGDMMGMRRRRDSRGRYM